MPDTRLRGSRRPSGEGVLLTDLYELTMLQACFDEGLRGTASFELFMRAQPPGRNFLVAAGLEQVLDYLAQLRFTAAEIAWLGGTKRFTPAFLASLADLRFTGDVDAMPEGTVVFADEPILRITAPLREAQLVETRVMNLLHYETLVATKSARCVGTILTTECGSRGFVTIALPCQATRIGVRRCDASICRLVRFQHINQY